MSYSLDKNLTYYYNGNRGWERTINTQPRIFNKSLRSTTTPDISGRSLGSSGISSASTSHGLSPTQNFYTSAKVPLSVTEIADHYNTKPLYSRAFTPDGTYHALGDKIAYSRDKEKRVYDNPFKFFSTTQLLSWDHPAQNQQLHLEYYRDYEHPSQFTKRPAEKV